MYIKCIIHYLYFNYFATLLYWNNAWEMFIILCPFWRPCSRWTGVSRYQNISVLDLIGAKGDGDGDNWSYKMCESSSQIVTTNKPKLFTAGCPSCHPTNSVGTEVKSKGISIIN